MLLIFAFTLCTVPLKSTTVTANQCNCSIAFWQERKAADCTSGETPVPMPIYIDVFVFFPDVQGALWHQAKTHEVLMCQHCKAFHVSIRQLQQVTWLYIHTESTAKHYHLLS